MTPTEKAALKHHCTTCHAEPGQLCMRERGQEGNSHRARRRAGRRSKVLVTSAHCTCPEVFASVGLA